MDILLFIGRLLYGAYFLVLGGSYIKNARRIAKREGLAKVPFAPIIIYACALLSIAGGLGVVLGWHTNLALGALIFMLIFTSLRLHDYWNLDEPENISVEMAHFLKNLALIGAALMMYSLITPWPLSI
ncbi:MAG TPA: DoxX family membrane protein [Candidatus Paceibacterota bacterium]|nr:DoxX family membrane protein [Candidatus Paceibacterota bacterium]